MFRPFFSFSFVFNISADDESKKLLQEIVDEAKNIIKENFSEEKGKMLIELTDYIAFRKN